MKRDALERAPDLVAERLDPEQTNDPETLGIWGAIHKGLFDATGARAHLDQALASYERGFHLKRDTYNGVNYAFLLDTRAERQEAADEATADRVLLVERGGLTEVDPASVVDIVQIQGALENTAPAGEA